MKPEQLRTFHGPKSWNATAEKNAVADRALGIKAETAGYAQLWLNPFRLLKVLIQTDIFNFYAGYTLFPVPINWHWLYRSIAGWDVFLLKALGKKVVMHFQGCEIRDRYNAQSLVCAHCAIREEFCAPWRSRERRARLNRLAGIADAVAVTTPDLIKYIKAERVHFIPKVYPLVELPPRQAPPLKNVIRIVHAPSHRSKKGTDTIIRVLNKYPEKFELILVENKTREELFELAATAHLAVDQLRIGWYGNFAVEMMMLGLPVVAFISEELNEFSKEIKLPVINQSERFFERSMLELWENRHTLHEIGKQSRDFAMSFHSLDSIAGRLREVYNDALKEND